MEPMPGNHAYPPGVTLRQIEGNDGEPEKDYGRCWECKRTEVIDEDGLCAYCARDMERK